MDRAGCAGPVFVDQKISVAANLTWSEVMIEDSPLAAAMRAPLARWFAFLNIPPDHLWMAVTAASSKRLDLTPVRE